jgi:hypothetical protein
MRPGRGDQVRDQAAPWPVRPPRLCPFTVNLKLAFVQHSASHSLEYAQSGNEPVTSWRRFGPIFVEIHRVGAKRSEPPKAGVEKWTFPRTATIEYHLVFRSEADLGAVQR